MAKAKDKETSTSTKLSFEGAVQRLEEIVQRLETGEVVLDESLSLFEEGIKLAKFCSGKLDEAEGKLEILLGFDGKEPRVGEFKLNTEEN